MELAPHKALQQAAGGAPRKPLRIGGAIPVGLQMADQSDNLASDVLRGCASIAAFVGLDERRAFTGLQEGWLPGWKEGNLWVSTKSRLRAHYNSPRPDSTA